MNHSATLYNATASCDLLYKKGFLILYVAPSTGCDHPLFTEGAE